MNEDNFKLVSYLISEDVTHKNQILNLKYDIKRHGCPFNVYNSQC